MTFDDSFKNNIFFNCKQANLYNKAHVCERKANVDITETHERACGDQEGSGQINVTISPWGLERRFTEDNDPQRPATQCWDGVDGPAKTQTAD